MLKLLKKTMRYNLAKVFVTTRTEQLMSDTQTRLNLIVGRAILDSIRVTLSPT